MWLMTVESERVVVGSGSKSTRPWKHSIQGVAMPTRAVGYLALAFGGPSNPDVWGVQVRQDQRV